MQVILNARILRAQRAGIGTYIAELAHALQQITSLQLYFFDGINGGIHLPTPAISSGNNIGAKLRDFPFAYRLRRYIEQRRFDRAVASLQPAVYHDPSLWPLDFAGPTVMTVHDLTHLRYPQTQPAARLREIERHLAPSLQRAQRVLVDSEFIAQELQQHFTIAREKIVVAPLACSTQFYPRAEHQLHGTLARFDLHYRDYFLCVGTLEPRKNLALALQAHAQLPPTVRARYPLIIVGGHGWETAQFQPQLQSALASGHVRVLGYLDESILPQLVAGAKALLFPSLYEGFGIPVLEAMASGVPVICTNVASLPEVGGDAVRYISPDDATALSLAMNELIDDEKIWRQLSTAGIARAQLFSWKKCAAITAQTYAAALREY